MLLVVSPALLIVDDRLRRRCFQFDLSAHFLQACSKRINLLLLLRDFGFKVLL
jgi:hypothetical protein